MESLHKGFVYSLLVIYYAILSHRKMAKPEKMVMVLLLALFVVFQPATAGPAAYGICQTGCNTDWVACVGAAGGIAGVSTGGAGVSAAILACNTAQGVCMAACVAAGCSPTL